MPSSPLIRPLSPLQTHCAPSLPEAYSLAGVVIQPFSAALLETPVDASNQGSSFAPNWQQGGHAASLPQVNAGNAPLVAMPSPALPPLLTHALAPTFHSMVGDALSVEMLRESYAAQLQNGDQQRPAPGGFRSSPDGTSAPSRPRLSSDAGAMERPSASDASHFGPPRRAQPPNSARFSHNHPYLSTEAVRVSAAPQRTADAPAPTAGTSSLLRSAATTALEAAWPSYGAALLLKGLSRERVKQRGRCYSHLSAQGKLQGTSSLPSSTQHGCRRGEAVSRTSSLSSGDGASTASGSDGVDPSKRSAALLSTASAICHNNAATRDGNGQLDTFAITASRASVKAGKSVVAGLPASSDSRLSKARVVSALASVPLCPARSEVPRRTQTGVSQTGSCILHYAGGSVGGKEYAVREEEENTFFDASYGLSREASQTTQPDTLARPQRQSAPKKKGKAPKGPVLATTLFDGVAGAPWTASSASLSAQSCPSRHVYPALEECRRLLDEIRIVSPLLRRCLTPPRPLESPSAGDCGDTTAFNLTHTASSGGCVASRDVPEVAQRKALSSSSPSSTAAAVVRPKRVTLSPRPEARRLYSWDKATAADDLSYMHGSFQQSSERFATSVARQLKRLQRVGTRLYGGAPDTSAYRTEVDLPTERRLSSASSLPMTPSSGSAGRYLNNDVCSRKVNTVDDSPCGRLLQLLRETEAAMPFLSES
ncbi:hypothetical protein JKF63_00206 [Porcisia hertigi]|uniref:Uncharacterized protein n=1 Tax=Porcisia hertigi TaxID=2761500 RepID=A0A836KY49_9TRYP|nr:hypothetical protein JKF63_00206 [Porcisia hertigi]